MGSCESSIRKAKALPGKALAEHCRHARYTQLSSDIDFESSYLATGSKKTRKSMGLRPVPLPIVAELKEYVSDLDREQEKLFNCRFKQQRWNKIRHRQPVELLLWKFGLKSLVEISPTFEQSLLICQNFIKIQVRNKEDDLAA